MSAKNRVVWGCLGVIGLVLVGLGTLVALNFDAVSKNFAEAVATQSESTQATLFRWGELMSISAELKSHYGVEPDVAYETGTGDRVLSISFSDYRLPGGATAEGHAREIAAFALGKTAKSDQIDRIEVSFLTPPKKGVVETTGSAESYSFVLDDLRPARPKAGRTK